MWVNERERERVLLLVRERELWVYIIRTVQYIIHMCTLYTCIVCFCAVILTFYSLYLLTNIYLFC